MSNSEVFTNDSFVQAGGDNNVSPDLISGTVGQECETYSVNLGRTSGAFRPLGNLTAVIPFAAMSRLLGTNSSPSSARLSLT